LSFSSPSRGVPTDGGWKGGGGGSSRVEPSLVLEHQFFPPARLTDFFTSLGLRKHLHLTSLPYLTTNNHQFVHTLHSHTRTPLVVSITPGLSHPDPPDPPSPRSTDPAGTPPSSCTDVCRYSTTSSTLDERAGMYSPIMYLSVWSRVSQNTPPIRF
jgi:hypothetical protein